MTMKIKLFQLYISLILALFMANIAYSQSTIAVAGMVVDENGNPIKNARVSMLYPPCENCFDHIIPSYRTGEEGVFFLNGKNIKAKQVEIFIEEPIPNELWNPIDVIGLALENFAYFKGVKFNDSKSKEMIQLGKVSPHLKYRAISIDLIKLFNGNKTFSEDNSSLKISINYKNEKIVDNLLVHNRSIDKENQKVNFALPTGKWNLSFEIYNGNQRTMADVSVEINGDDQIKYDYIRCTNHKSD